MAVAMLKIQIVSAKQTIIVIDKQTMQHIGLLNTQPFAVSIKCVCVYVCRTHTDWITSLLKQSHPCPSLLSSNLSLLLIFSSYMT